MPDFSKIPQALKDCQCWLVAKLVPSTKRPGRTDKIPWDIKANRPLSGDWIKGPLLQFSEAAALLPDSKDFVLGFAFEHSPYLGLDFDDALDADGIPKPQFRDAWKEWCAGNYVERSPSGKGFRAFLLKDGPLPKNSGIRDSYPMYGGGQVEVFSGWWCTVTGDEIGGPNPVKSASPVEVYSWFEARAKADEKADEAGGRNPGLLNYAGGLKKKGLSYQELRSLVLAANQNLAEPLDEEGLERTVLRTAKGWYAEGGAKPERKLFLKADKSIDQCEMETYSWLWHNVLRNGCVNLLIGLPDVGKSMVEASIIAAVTVGSEFPLSKRTRPPKKVLLVSYEDPLSLWRARVLAAEGDETKLIPVAGMEDPETHEVIPWRLDEPAHLAELEKQIQADREIGLVVIDPLCDLLGHSDLNKAGDIRKVTGALNGVVQRTGVCMIVATHTTKALVDSVIKTAAGSIQLMASMLVAYWLVESADKKGLRLMLCARNKGGKKRSFEYEIVSADWPKSVPRGELEEDEEDDGVGLVVWKGRSSVDPNDLLASLKDQGESLASRCRKFLNEFLKNGPVESGLCIKSCEAAGFDGSCQQRACSKLGVEKDGKTWRLKKEPVQEKQADIGF